MITYPRVTNPIQQAADIKMTVNDKLVALKQIYQIHDEVTAPYAMACQRYCAHCCTRNVTLTTLEGCFITDYLQAGKNTDLFRKVRQASGEKRFQPKITINRLADLCAAGEEGPGEVIDPEWGKCPILTTDDCPIYPVRPFGCRAMVSKKDCNTIGYADMDPFVLTLNTVFLQFIENLDARGCTGNLTDIMMFFESNRNRRLYSIGIVDEIPDGLIANQPMKVLMIPPEHRSKLASILSLKYSEEIDFLKR